MVTEVNIVVYFNSKKNKRNYLTHFLPDRFGANAFLTVSADIHNRETVMVNGSSVSANTMLEFNNQSVIYLGGLPRNQTVNTGITKLSHRSGITFYNYHSRTWQKEGHNILFVASS